MTTPPTPEAVEAAMKWAGGLPLLAPESNHVRSFAPKAPGRGLNHHALRILAAEVERLRCELGHAQEQLERIRLLCMGHGVGLRDDVLDVVGRGEVSRGMPYPGSAQDMMEDVAALAGAVVTARPK